MTKTTAISLAIVTLTKTGLSVSEAVDQVLGAGTYERIASDVYDGLTK